MDIKILDSHLREYLDTKATPGEIARYISLCGPTVDRLKKVGRDWLYEIEVTTNRVDVASALGVAREAAAILPQFGIKAKMKKIASLKFQAPKEPLPLKLVTDPKLENRLTGIVLENIQKWGSPKWMVERLEAAGMRSLNAVVDITNYVMITVGHPCHAFDYDKIKNHTIKVRESRKGEKVTSFDNKTYVLPGGDIVFENADGEIIDLPGIIGTKNSVVSKDSKRVLFFFDNNNPVRIRRTSMSLGVRTMAATLNEKRVDPEQIPLALGLGLELFKDICKASLASGIHDIYPRPYKPKIVKTTKGFIEKLLGVEIEKNKVSSLLSSLGFITKWNMETLSVEVPSFRAHDINVEEDIVEEVARIYGYHNLPSQLMTGRLPEPVFEAPFEFEEKLRAALKGFGGVETMTYSLVPKEMPAAAGMQPLRLSNPLGAETEYLRTTLKPSLLAAIEQNSGVENPLHLFEIANVYIPRKADLPEERMMLAGVFVNYDYRAAKGVLEAVFQSLNIKGEPAIESVNKYFYYELEVRELEKRVMPRTYKAIPKYPPHVEDITIEIPEEKMVGEVIQSIKQASKLVCSVELVDVYERKFTFRIEYLHPEKTLSDEDVRSERRKIEKSAL